jgi:hypothetical protein
VEQPLVSLESAIRPWRTATVIAAGVAAIELVVILFAGVALLGKNVSREVKQAAESWAFPAVDEARRTTARAGAPKLARPETRVIVLNGNGRTGAASAVAGRVKARGYKIASVGNAKSTDYARTTVMYRRGYRPEALRLARDMRIKVVGPLDGMTRRDLMGAQLALVVGN